MNKIALAVASAALIAVSLTGCSSAKTYESTSQLRTAYEKAGGSCSKKIDLPESMTSAGAHGISCLPTIDSLFVFDSAKDKNRYVASVLGDDNDLQIVSGDRWVVTTSHGDKYAKALGGQVEKP